MQIKLAKRPLGDDHNIWCLIYMTRKYQWIASSALELHGEFEDHGVIAFYDQDHNKVAWWYGV